MSAEGKPFEDKLRDAGLRVTRQRVRVLEILSEGGEHLSADAIYARSRSHDAAVSLATIYRTLNALEEANIVRPQYPGRSHEKEHYERADGADHFHFTCWKCEGVYEFQTDLVEDLQRELRSSRGWQVEDVCMCFEGLCGECAEEGNEE